MRCSKITIINRSILGYSKLEIKTMQRVLTPYKQGVLIAAFAIYNFLMLVLDYEQLYLTTDDFYKNIYLYILLKLI